MPLPCLCPSRVSHECSHESSHAHAHMTTRAHTHIPAHRKTILPAQTSFPCLLSLPHSFYHRQSLVSVSLRPSHGHSARSVPLLRSVQSRSRFREFPCVVPLSPLCLPLCLPLC